MLHTIIQNKAHSSSRAHQRNTTRVHEEGAAGLASTPGSERGEEQWSEFYNSVKDNVSIADKGQV